MSTPTSKAISLAAELKAALAPHFTNVSDVQFDTDGCPYLTASQGTLVAGQQAALVKLIALQPLGVDGLGLTPRSFGPHTMQVVLEMSTITNVGLMTDANKMLLLENVGKFGTKIELYMSANTVAISLAAITGTPKGIFEGASLKYKTMAAM